MVTAMVTRIPSYQTFGGSVISISAVRGAGECR